MSLAKKLFETKGRGFIKVALFFGYFSLSFALLSCLVNQTETQRVFKNRFIKERKLDFRERQNYDLESQDLIEFKEAEAINYLAIGDSMSHGFLQNPFAVSPGFINYKGEGEGLSFPAILADLIARAAPGKLESFANLSVSGSTVYYWAYYLANKRLNYQDYRKEAESILDLNQDLNLIPDSSLNEGAKRFLNYREDPNFKNLKAAVKAANLITISLGANTVISLVFKVLAKIYQKMVKLNSVEASLFSNFNQLYMPMVSREVERAKRAYAFLVNRIKAINPYANIVLVGYPFSVFLLIDWIVNLIFPDPSGKQFNLFHNIFAKLLELVRDTARVTNTSFVNLYNEPLWSDFQRYTYTTSIFDFHPSIQGYRWIARQIFLKLTQNQANFKLYLSSPKHRSHLLLSDESEYLDFDRGEFRREIFLKEETINDLQRMIRGDIDKPTRSEINYQEAATKNEKFPDFFSQFLNQTTLQNIQLVIKQIISSFPEGDVDRLKAELKTTILEALKTKEVNDLIEQIKNSGLLVLNELNQSGWRGNGITLLRTITDLLDSKDSSRFEEDLKSLVVSIQRLLRAVFRGVDFGELF